MCGGIPIGNGSWNRSPCGRSTYVTPRALHAFQFLQNILISSSSSPIATVEIMHFHEDIAAGSEGWGLGGSGTNVGPIRGHVCLQEPCDDD